MRDGRDGQATRAAILDIARSQFGSHGFERTTIRSVASAASVDPALVMHYFGNKAALFAAASQFDINFPDLIGRCAGSAGRRPAADVRQGRGARRVRSCRCCGRLRPTGPPRTLCSTVFVSRVAPALAAVMPDRAPERAALVGSQLLGLAVARYILGVPPLTAMSDATTHRVAAPGLAHYLTDPAP